jgi:hypothetical protein
MKSNPGERRAALEAALRESLEAAQRGECCDCGEPIWVLGSATGQSNPTDDYEITAVW